MAWSPIRTNQLLFTYGDIQCSPAEIQQLNMKPLTVFTPRTVLDGPLAGYTVLLTGGGVTHVVHFQFESASG